MLPTSSPISSAVPADFSKASIKSRLTRQAAELWGYHEADLDGFDPLVQLLLEACAVEFEKVGSELRHTQHLLLERLATILNPDVVAAPSPAHAVAQATPPTRGEDVTELPSDAQFAFTLAAAGRPTVGQPIFFSPLQTTRLVNGGVRCLATEANVWQILPTGQKRLLADTATPLPPTHRRLWIGVELSAQSAALDDLVFYFDWLNEPRRMAYAAFLPGEQWLLGEQQLTASLTQIGAESGVNSRPLHEEYNFLRRLEGNVHALYAPNFVHLTGPAGALAAYPRCPYPSEIAASFDPAVLRSLVQPLVWLEVRFADALPPEAFDQIVCALNCFPVINRRLHKSLFRLRPALNLFPLTSEEPFLAMRDVYSLSNVVYRSTTLSDLIDSATDTYTLRTHGVGRFDSRTGREALRELLDLLRDESRAFAAAGTDFIGSILREIDQNLARLEERLDRNTEVEQPVPYLLLRPQDVNDSVYVEYWSSNGEAGNRLPAGSRLQLQDGPPLDEVRLLTTTSGGRERPSAEERTHALRRNLLTRNRLVTQADITAACWAELGAHLAAVYVEKGFQNGATPTAGFVRCIRVSLTPKDPSHLTAPEWERAAQTLRVTLAGQSAMNLPYEVVVKQ